MHTNKMKKQNLLPKLTQKDDIDLYQQVAEWTNHNCDHEGEKQELTHYCSVEG